MLRLIDLAIEGAGCDPRRMRLTSVHTYPIKGGHRLDHDGAVAVEPWGLAGDRRWMIVDGAGNGVTQREASALVALCPAPRPGGLVLRAPGRPPLEVAEPAAGEPVTVRVFSGLPAVPARAAGAAAADWLSAFLGLPVRLVWLADPAAARPIQDPALDGAEHERVSFADGYPLLVANLASLDELNAALLAQGSAEAPLPMTRFRPNLVVSGAGPWAEDGWTGRRIRVGTVIFRGADPCGRCLVTTIDQETGERGREPLRVLAARRRSGERLLFGLNLIPELPPPGPYAVAAGDPVEILPR